MASSLATLCNEGKGFDFEYVQRNALLTKRGVKEPTQRTTGTTLAGLIFKDGVILGADTRSTVGPVVAVKNTDKLHHLTSNICCAGAGVSSDCNHVTSMVSSALTLHQLATGRQARVITAETIIKNHLRRYQGHISAALILGGVDFKGPHLTTIYPHGSTDSLPYGTMGSGSLNAMTALETHYREGMSKEEGMDLITQAIRAGIYNDLASGSNVDLIVITKDGSERIRGHQYLMDKLYQRVKPIVFPPGTSKVLKEVILSFKEVTVEDADAMDTT